MCYSSFFGCLSCAVYIMNSAALISCNKTLMSHDRFPQPLALVTMHMGSGFLYYHSIINDSNEPQKVYFCFTFHFSFESLVRDSGEFWPRCIGQALLCSATSCWAWLFIFYWPSGCHSFICHLQHVRTRFFVHISFQYLCVESRFSSCLYCIAPSLFPSMHILKVMHSQFLFHKFWKRTKNSEKIQWLIFFV